MTAAEREASATFAARVRHADDYGGDLILDFSRSPWEHSRPEDVSAAQNLPDRDLSRVVNASGCNLAVTNYDNYLPY